MKMIEKPIENFSNFSIENLDSILGGGVVLKCNTGATLTCTPFKRSCLTVTIGEETYICQGTGKLKKEKSVIDTQNTSSGQFIDLQVYYL